MLFVVNCYLVLITFLTEITNWDDFTRFRRLCILIRTKSKVQMQWVDETLSWKRRRWYRLNSFCLLATNCILCRFDIYTDNPGATITTAIKHILRPPGVIKNGLKSLTRSRRQKTLRRFRWCKSWVDNERIIRDYHRWKACCILRTWS